MEKTEKLIDELINLILVPTLTSEEREILVEYKDKLPRSAVSFMTYFLSL